MPRTKVCDECGKKFEYFYKEENHFIYCDREFNTIAIDLSKGGTLCSKCVDDLKEKELH